MKNPVTQHFCGTHAKAILTDNQVLSQVLAKHTLLVKERYRKETNFDPRDPFTLLDDRQLDDALNGPLQTFFTTKFKAYAALARMRMELKLKQDENLKDKRAPKLKEDELPARLLENITLANLEGIQKKLDELTEKHMQQWDEHVYQWKQSLLETLHTSGQNLAEVEIKEMQDEEPISELLERFTELNIQAPKAALSKMNYENYLHLKVYLIIYSLLGRQHKSNQANDIKPIMKYLKTVFANIRAEENRSITSQQQETNDAIAPISVAITK